jgi:hypothetical protein
MESTDQREENKVPEIFSKTIRAGKRTYFFDVKCTRNNEYYLTITESKKKFADDGSFRYEKHKLFLYPEDFEKFTDVFTEVIDFINENQPAENIQEKSQPEEKSTGMKIEQEVKGNEFSKIDFDDI